ncbi:MAG: hypothetical protein K8R69_07195 [Deltaproteobacteria bacterium]|nr:hypothetical protein [Deltaproteobacteria bacterium]
MMRRLTLFLSLLLITPCALHAADAPAKGPSAVQALSVYPADIRQATVAVLGYPGTLVQLAQIQAKTSASFKDLLASVPLETQKKLWQLVKYPTLVEELVDLGPQTKNSVKQINASYPKDLQAIAADLSVNHFDLLQQTKALKQPAMGDFSQALQSLPPTAQNSFRTVGQHSEILHLLNQSLSLSSYSPDSFKKDPGPLTQKSQALASALQQAPVAAHPENNWKPAPGDDPKAVAALQKDATQFEKQNDYELDQNPHPKGAVQASVGYTPYNSVFTPVGWAYPFWFGFPAWDPYPFM